MPEPIISVVVCTHDRPEDLRRCLDALAAVPDSIEVIVVDSASNPPSSEIVDRYATAVPGLRCIREETPPVTATWTVIRGIVLIS